VDKNTNNTQQAFWIALGSLFSFSFGIISSVILSRYFAKADYGTYKQVLYVYSTMLVVFTLGLPKTYSFFLPRVNNYEAKDVIAKITNIFFIMGAFFTLSLFLLSGQIASLLKNEDLELAIKIFSPVPFFLLPTMGLEGILATYRMTYLTAIYTVISRIAMMLCVVLPVLFFDAGYIGALIGFTFSSFLIFLVALYLKYLPIKKYSKEKSSLKYKDIFNYSLPLMIASLWGVIETSSDQFFISRYYGTEVFADYSNGAMELPFIGMILGATAAVLSPIFSKMSYQKVDVKKELYPLWIRVFEKSSMLTYPLLIFALFFAKEIMVFLYGESYINSAIYFQIFNLYFFFKIIVYGPYLINTGKQRLYANAHMYSVMLLIPVQLITIYFIDSPIALIIVSVFVKIGRTFFFLNVISKDFKMQLRQILPIKSLIKIMLPSAILAFFTKYILIERLELNNFWLLFLGVSIYFSLYGLYSYIFKINYWSIVSPMIKRNIK
jgi:O-antigen/teichoic acid export membrane protein